MNPRIPFLLLALLSILSCSAVSYVNHWNKGRGYYPFQHISSEGILLNNETDVPLIDSIPVINPESFISSAKQNFRLSFRIDNRHGHPSRKYSFRDSTGAISYLKNPSWGFFFSGNDGRRCWITISRQKEKAFSDFDDAVPGTIVTISKESNDDSPVINAIGRANMKEDSLPFSGESLWIIEYKEGMLNIAAGAHAISFVSELPIELNDLASLGFAASPGAEVLVSDISLSISPANPPVASADISELDKIFLATEDPIEGYWEIFDRTLEESLLKLGGDYKLAIVKNGANYEIIYLAGAVTNGKAWKPGMLKGILTPTSFPGLLNLEWIDAQGERISNSVTAQTGYNSTLTLQFPYHSSVVRLRKAEPMAE